MAQYVSVGNVSVLVLTSVGECEAVRMALAYFGIIDDGLQTRTMKIAMNILNEMRDPEESDG